MSYQALATAFGDTGCNSRCRTVCPHGSAALPQSHKPTHKRLALQCASQSKRKSQSSHLKRSCSGGSSSPQAHNGQVCMSLDAKCIPSSREAAAGLSLELDCQTARRFVTLTCDLCKHTPEPLLCYQCASSLAQRRQRSSSVERGVGREEGRPLLWPQPPARVSVQHTVAHLQSICCHRA